MSVCVNISELYFIFILSSREILSKISPSCYLYYYIVSETLIKAFIESSSPFLLLNFSGSISCFTCFIDIKQRELFLQSFHLHPTTVNFIIYALYLPIILWISSSMLYIYQLYSEFHQPCFISTIFIVNFIIYALCLPIIKWIVSTMLYIY